MMGDDPNYQDRKFRKSVPSWVAGNIEDGADKAIQRGGSNFYHASWVRSNSAFDIGLFGVATRTGITPPSWCSAGNVRTDTVRSGYRIWTILSWTGPSKIQKAEIVIPMREAGWIMKHKVDVNDILIDVICEQIAEFNPDLDHELSKKGRRLFPTLSRDHLPPNRETTAKTVYPKQRHLRSLMKWKFSSATGADRAHLSDIHAICQFHPCCLHHWGWEIPPSWTKHQWWLHRIQ